MSNEEVTVGLFLKCQMTRFHLWMYTDVSIVFTLKFCFGFRIWITVLYIPFWYLQTVPHSWLITGFGRGVTRRVPLVEQELFTLLEPLSLFRFRVRVVLLDLQFSVYCFVDYWFSLYFFFWPLYCLSFFNFIASDDPPFGIFKLFLGMWCNVF